MRERTREIKGKETHREEWKTEGEEIETETHRERDRDREKSQRETEAESNSEREREWGREREGEKHVRHTLCYKMHKTLHGMKHHTQQISPRLPFVSSNHTSHSIKQGHPQHTIEPHFYSVSISIVIFHTAHRATGSSSLVVYSKQYRISV